MSTKPIIERMDEILKPHGFFRHKATWNRKCDAFVDVIDVQKNKFGDAITMNAGVLHPGVHMKCWGTALPAIVQEPECIVRARIGKLSEGKDIWWRLDNHGIFNDMATKLSALVLPFLERMHSFEAMEQFLTSAQVIKQKYPPPVIYLAILKSERGDNTGACALLADFNKKTGVAWHTRISEVMERLGCS